MLDFTNLPLRVKKNKTKQKNPLKNNNKQTHTGTKKQTNKNLITLLNQLKLSFTHWTPFSKDVIKNDYFTPIFEFIYLFLYLFQALPIFISKIFFFNVLHSVLSPHTWEGKHPRPIFKSLKLKGGLQHFNNFCFYYWAANISCLCFCTCTSLRVAILTGWLWNYTATTVHLFWLYLVLHFQLCGETLIGNMGQV